VLEPQAADAPTNQKRYEGCNYSNKREQSGDTNQPISHANLPLGKIPKARRNSPSPDIDPVGLMEHPVRGENFIHGDWAPREEPIPSCTARDSTLPVPTTLESAVPPGPARVKWTAP